MSADQGQVGEGDVLFARVNLTQADMKTELRGMVSNSVIGVLDAVSLTKGQSRMDLVNEILHQWAKKKVDEASLIARVMRGNPSFPESDGGPSQ